MIYKYPKNIQFHILILLCFAIYHTSSFAQYDNLKFRYLNSNDGLSQNYISCILQDKTGFMWFGTKDGLNRYDGYKFKVFRNNPFDTSSVSENYIRSIFEDSRGRLFVGSSNLDLFNNLTESFQRIKLPLNNTGQEEPDPLIVLTINEDKKGTIWAGTNHGLFSLDSNLENIIHYTHNPLDKSGLLNNYVKSVSCDDSLVIIGTMKGLNLIRIHSTPINIELFEDFSNDKNISADDQNINAQYRASSDILYAGTVRGLLKFNLSTKEINLYTHTESTFSRYWYGRILSICPDKYGNLWLAGSGALIIFNPVHESYEYIYHNPEVEQSLNFNGISYVYSDRGGKIWVGTTGMGLNVYDQNRKDFITFSGFINKEPYKSTFSIKAILSDSENNLWISSGNKIYNIKMETGEYKRNSFLPSGNYDILSIAEDKHGNVWFASTEGLIKLDTSSKKIRHYKSIKTNPGSLKDKEVSLVFIDSKGKLWVVNSNYLSQLDNLSDSFIHHNLTFSLKIENIIINHIYEDNNGDFWLAWSEGLVRFNPETNRWKLFKNDLNDKKSISNNKVTCINEDPNQPGKFLWIGTNGGGLNRFDLENKIFEHYLVEDGLPNNVIYGILQAKNEFWLSTNNGLCRVRTDKYGKPSFRNYDVTDGLQGNEFNSMAYHRSRTGELFFGGLNGFSAFLPEKIRDNIYIPPVVITNLTILSKSAETGFSNIILNESSEITLPYSENTFIIEFAALDYTAPFKNKYKYQLIPLNDNWIETGTDRTVTFTGLSPGKYIFKVTGSNNDGIWNEEGTSLKIIISPPFWRTIWAYGFYSLVLLSVLYGLRRYEMNRLQLKNRLKQEYFETQKLKEIDEMKSGFFANISHEFRTPLTLIIGPSEQLEAEETNEQRKEMLRTIRKSANRLLRLINQILDLSKLEKGKTELSCSPGDIAEFIKGITISFASIAERKKIQIKISTEPDYIPMYFDKDVIEKIFYNLLSNAFKFSPGGGIIEVLISETNRNADKKHCLISVKDSGVGISEYELSKVFTKFYQVDSSAGYSNQGSGIGLALVKELVELHYGEINVESKLNEGTTFSVLLPLGKEHLKSEEIVQPNERPFQTPVDRLNELADVKIGSSLQEENSSGKQNGEHLIVLVVEDNTDVRKYISDHLQNTYKVLNACDGLEGFQKATESIPDVIISDIMMPGMNGYELCKKIKTDERTSHIPVILLTARAGEEDKMEGLETGADDYLTKPFNSKELLIRVKNLIEIRQKLRKKFSSSLVIKPKEIAASSIDKIFIEKALNVVEQNIRNENFSVMDFSREMSLSHSQLHRKLKALLNQSANQFIRSVKMQRALELLKSKAGTIAEIGYQVGYNDPSYFTKTFSSHFGYLPSEVNNNT